MKGQRFRALGPVDQRRAAPFTLAGNVLCPYCAEADRDFSVGLVSRRMLDTLLPLESERVRAILERSRALALRRLVAHLALDHYRCTACGWVGVRPAQHVARSPHHEARAPKGPRPRPRARRLSDVLAQ